MPAGAATVVAFIDGMARVKAPSTVRRYVWSIATLHKALGHTNPLESALVRFALQRMHRLRGRRQAQVQGLTWPMRNRLLEVDGDRLIDVRNRALLGVAYDTLLRRSELVSLEVSDLLEDVDGSATLLVRAGKTDPDRRGAMLYLARDTVKLVRAWLEASGVGEGLLFRSVRKDGAVRGKLDPSQVPRIYKRMARRAGLPDDDRRRPGRAQHARRAGSGYDRLRHRVAGHPAGRPVEDDAHGATLRGTVAGPPQRRGPAGRAPAALKKPRPEDCGPGHRFARAPPIGPSYLAVVIASKNAAFLLKSRALTRSVRTSFSSVETTTSRVNEVISAGYS